MKYKRIDMTGQRFGRYSVLGFAFVKNGRAYWKCKCDCGTIKNVRGTSLRIGQTKSCGCYAIDVSIEVNSGKNSHMFGKKRPEHSKKMKGKNHPRYNFNMTEEERQIGRTYTKYREWRTSVYERDNYTCQYCGTTKSPFNAHHLNGHDKFIELRIEVTNGITLCEVCHKEFHRQYGRGNNTEAQFINFINKKGDTCMIITDVNFKPFFKRIKSIFSDHFSVKEVKILMEFVYVLSESNLKCYIANMQIIAHRKDKDIVDDNKLIADMEWVARSVGEYRVASKANINKYISSFKSTKPLEFIPPESWESDDIVYSIGEMMDRLSIETIKREDFSKNNRPAHMIDSSQELRNRVEKYLIAKLEEVDEKGFYECVHEQRTYDLEGIVKDLAI